MTDKPPVQLVYASPPPRRPFRPLALLGIAVTTVVAAMLFGASTNAINGAISPFYFMIVMGWGPRGVWLASIRQGVLEGFVFGTILSFILAVGIGAITRATCTYVYAMRWLAGVLIAVYAFWILGGALGVVLAAASPDSFRHMLNSFNGAPVPSSEILRFAWVGGTIWGAYFGGPTTVIGGLIIFSAQWRRRMLRESGRGHQGAGTDSPGV